MSFSASTLLDQLQWPQSPFARAMVDRGRSLYAAGLRIHQVAWDADEVLWDWSMSLGRMLASAPVAVPTLSVAHRESFQMKSGVIELLMGWSHASREAGDDPHMRIWTNGYAWRIGQIAERVPALAWLLGPNVRSDAPWHQHPRVFCRPHFVTAAHRLLEADGREHAAEVLGREEAEYLLWHFERNPVDSTLKLPGFAAIAGKTGFVETRWLVDDSKKNTSRFAGTGRRSLCPLMAVPKTRLGVRNVAWWEEPRFLTQADTQVATGLAAGFERLAKHPGGTWATVEPEPVFDYEPVTFALQIPDERLRGEWIAPLRGLKHRVYGRRRGPKRGEGRELKRAA